MGRLKFVKVKDIAISKCGWDVDIIWALRLIRFEGYPISLFNARLNISITMAAILLRILNIAIIIVCLLLKLLQQQILVPF